MATWHVAEGTLVLLEPAGTDTMCLTATVVGEHDGHTVVDLGTAAPVFDFDAAATVNVSAFAPEALWKLRATVHRAFGAPASVLELWPDGEAERIQRRLSPRLRIELQVHLLNLDDDDPVMGNLTGTTVDVGPGGLRVRVPVPLPPACDPTVHFILPDGHEVVALAAIIAAEPSLEGFEYRLVFTGLDDGDRDALRLLAASEDEAAA